jgi:hypothetical protein
MAARQATQEWKREQMTAKSDSRYRAAPSLRSEATAGRSQSAAYTRVTFTQGDALEESRLPWAAIFRPDGALVCGLHCRSPSF